MRLFRFCFLFLEYVPHCKDLYMFPNFVGGACRAMRKGQGECLTLGVDSFGYTGKGCATYKMDRQAAVTSLGD